MKIHPRYIWVMFFYACVHYPSFAQNTRFRAYAHLNQSVVQIKSEISQNIQNYIFLKNQVDQTFTTYPGIVVGVDGNEPIAAAPGSIDIDLQNQIQLIVSGSNQLADPSSNSVPGSKILFLASNDVDTTSRVNSSQLFDIDSAKTYLIARATGDNITANSINFSLARNRDLPKGKFNLTAISSSSSSDLLRDLFTVTSPQDDATVQNDGTTEIAAQNFTPESMHFLAMKPENHNKQYYIARSANKNSDMQLAYLLGLLFEVAYNTNSTVIDHDSFRYASLTFGATAEYQFTPFVYLGVDLGFDSPIETIENNSIYVTYTPQVSIHSAIYGEANIEGARINAGIGLRQDMYSTEVSVPKTDNPAAPSIINSEFISKGENTSEISAFGYVGFTIQVYDHIDLSMRYTLNRLSDNIHFKGAVDDRGSMQHQLISIGISTDFTDRTLM